MIIVAAEGRGRRGSLVSPRGLLLALAGAILLSWPMLVAGAPLLFYDSAAYLNEGEKIFATVFELLRSEAATGHGTGVAQGNDASLVASAASQVETLRSAAYSSFVYATSLSPVGPVGTTIAQAALVLFLFGALVPKGLRVQPSALVLAALACAALTSLPWFASFLMPDLLAAGVILYAAVLVRSFDELDTFQSTVLAAIGAFAIISHYGHIPLAAACIGAALLLRLLQRRLTLAVAAFALAPLLAAIGANAALGILAFDGPSVAPRRLPLILARSIEDGPARWHLEEHCATYQYAVCGLFEEIPSNVGEFMWGEAGVRHATGEQMANVRAEELTIVWRAFLEYPVQQTWSLFGNVTRQMVSLGTNDFNVGVIRREADDRRVVHLDVDARRGMIRGFGAVHAASVAAAVLALTLLGRAGALGAGNRRLEVLVVVVVGLLANAAIFGGLSAPADRYQSRVAWLLPALAALFWLEHLGRPRALAQKEFGLSG